MSCSDTTQYDASMPSTRCSVMAACLAATARLVRWLWGGGAESCGAAAPEAAERALLLRTLRRKLTAVEALEAKHAHGASAPLEAAQRAKLARREGLSAAVAALERGDVAAAVRAEAQADAAAAAARAALEAMEATQHALPAWRRHARALSSSPSVPPPVPVPPSPASLPPRTPLAAAAAAPPGLLPGSDGNAR